jgi:hypothetical protein
VTGPGSEARVRVRLPGPTQLNRWTRKDLVPCRSDGAPAGPGGGGSRSGMRGGGPVRVGAGATVTVDAPVGAIHCHRAGIAGRKRPGLRVSLASHADGLGYDSPRHVGHCDVRV